MNTTSLFCHNYCSFLLANNFMMKIAVPRKSCKIPCSLHQTQSSIIFIEKIKSIVRISLLNRKESNTLHSLVSVHLCLDGQSLLIDCRNLLLLKQSSKFPWKLPSYHLLSIPQMSVLSSSSITQSCLLQQIPVLPTSVLSVGPKGMS